MSGSNGAFSVCGGLRLREERGPGPGKRGFRKCRRLRLEDLTREQMLADYDAMWKDIEENYPLMGVAERTTGENFAQVKETYRERVGEAGTNEEFFSALNECLGKFAGCGHLNLLNADFYVYDLSLYGDHLESPHCAYLYKILDNPKSKAFYQYAPGGVSGQPRPEATT